MHHTGKRTQATLMSVPSTGNWKHKLEAVALKAGTPVVLTYTPGFTSSWGKAPTTFLIHDSCPSPLISPMLSHFHHQHPSQTTLPKHLLQTPLKRTCLAIGVWGREMRDFRENLNKRQQKIPTCTCYSAPHVHITYPCPSILLIQHCCL